MTDKEHNKDKQQEPSPNFLPKKETTTIPSCSTCGQPMTRCNCKHNDLIK